MQQHYNKWHNGGDKRIWVNGQSSIGFKPNNPGKVDPNQPFLLGAVRHNNLPVQDTANFQPYLHSSLNLQFGDLIPGDTGESFPFVNHETYNTLASTIIYRKGGAYVKTDGVSGLCSPQFGRNGWDATQRIGNRLPRDLVLNGEAGRPGYTPSGDFIGPAYEPDPVNAADRSQGYVNKPESRSGRMYCVKYVGEGNGDYDLYSQYYNKGAEQPENQVTKPKVLPRFWPGAKGNVNENPYVFDTVKLEKTASDRTFTKNGRTYRLHLWGFVPAENAHTFLTPTNFKKVPTANCPASPAANAELSDTFVTQELSVNYACLYGVITEERTVRIAKSVEDPDHANPTIPAASFGVTTGTTWRDNTNRSPMTTGNVSVTKPTASSAPVKSWYISSTDSATLTPTGFGEANTKYDSHFIPFEVTNSDFTISEDQIGDPQWKLKDIKCVNGIGEDVAVTKTERGVNFKNVGGAKTDAASPITCTFVNEYEAPKLPNLRVQKSIENNGGITGATEFDVDYKIVATNDGNAAGNTGKLTDKPDFAKGLEIQSAKVATTQAGLAGAANATASGGVYTLTNGVNLDPGKTAEFWIRFHVERNETAAGYEVKNLECTVTGSNVPTPGFGLFNQVIAENGKDSDGEDNNKACGPVPVSKMRVEKSIQVNGATTGATDFIVDYKIIATNDGNTKASTGKLTDKPDFAKGLEIQFAKVASTQAALTGAATVTPANGVYTLTNGVELDPGKTAEFWIRFHVKRNETAAGYDVKNLECKVTGNNVPTPGFGLFNQVIAENGKDSDGEDNNKACGPVPVSKMRVEKSIQVNGATTGATDFIVDYKIIATNDGNTKASTGKLTDKPDFAKGLEIQFAKVASTQAALTGAATVTPANGVYTLTNGVELDPGKTAEFWIRFQVKRNESATGYDVKNLECKLDANGIPTAGYGLFNQVVAESGKDHDGEDNNKACGPVPVTKIRVQKSIEANGGANTGATEFDVDYKIVATNDGNLKTSTGILTDKPEFAKGLEVQSAKVATTQAGLAGAANATAANGTYTLTNGVDVEPGKTAEFWIRFHVKFNSAAAGYDETALECKLDAKGIPTAGFGLFNQVNAQTGKDHDGIDNNKACGPYVPAKVRVEKSIEANGGATGAAEFDVDYKIVATNDGQIATTTGKLTDKPEFAKGLEIQSAKVATTQAGLAGAANATASGGVYTLTNGVTLQPGTTAEFWIRFHVKRNTAAAGYSETNLACRLDQKNLPIPGFGLFNQVYAENGKDHDGIDNNKACGPNVPHEIVVVKAGTQNTGKTFTDPTNQYTSADGSALYPLSGAEFAIYSGGNPQNSPRQDPVRRNHDGCLLLVSHRP